MLRLEWEGLERRILFAAGVLNVTGTVTSAAVDLTSVGTSDWIHWGVGGASGIDRKATGGSQISNFSVSPGAIVAYTKSGRPISWTDGSPNTTYSETAGSATGVRTNSANQTLLFTAPADSQTRELTVYLGSEASSNGTFAVSLSDGSAPAYTDTTSYNNTDKTYTIVYSAASAGQTLKVQWTNKSGNLYLSAAALQLIGPTVATAAAASPSPVVATATNLSVLGSDPAGESTLTYTWATTGTPPAPVSFSANGTNAAKNTVATFTKAGTYNFVVTMTDGAGQSASSNVSVTVAQTLTAISVAPASATLNENGTRQLTATALDQFANPMASQPGFAWSLGAGNGSVSSTGLYTAPGSAGSATIQAASGSVVGTASITVNNAAPTVAKPASASPGFVNGTTSNLSVLGADDGGEANLSYTWSASSLPSGAPAPRFSANGTNAAKNTAVTFGAAGTYVVLVTIVDAGGLSVTSSVSVTVSQVLTALGIDPPSPTLSTGAAQQFSAAAVDQFGNSMISAPVVVWSVSGQGSIGLTGLYSAPGVPGTDTVNATAGLISGSTTVSVVNGTVAVASPNPVNATGTTLSVLNAGSGSGLTYTWSAIAKPAGAADPSYSVNGTSAAQTTVVTFAQAGNYTFQVDISNGTSTTSDQVSVTVNQVLAAISVSPASATMDENGSRQFAATALDQFGGAMTTQPAFQWTLNAGGGSVDPTGLYQAPGASGTATISAASGSVAGTANVTIDNAAPTIAIPAAAIVDPTTGRTASLSVLGADDGGEPNLRYTWSLTSGPAAVSFSANGTNAAKSATTSFAQIGSYTFLATISDGQHSATSSVSVTVNAVVTTISVTPADATIDKNASQSFAATAYDQFGSVLATQPAFTWAVASGGGTVSGAGLYTAPSTIGSASVTASSGAATDVANISVTDQPPILNSSGGSASFVEKQGATIVDPAIAVADMDDVNLAGASVTLIGYVPGEDALAWTNVGSISSAWDATSGVLTLSGIAPVSQYQAALRAVTYADLSSDPNTSLRTARFVVSDGQALSAPADRPITVTAVNDPPQITSPAAPSVSEDGILVLSVAANDPIVIDDVDAEGAAEQVTLSGVNGSLTLAATAGLNVSQGTGINDPTVTFSGALSAIGAALDGLTFIPAAHYFGPAAVQVAVDDLGNTGTGGARTASASIPVIVLPVAHVPSVTPSTTLENTQSISGLVVAPNPLDSFGGYFKITRITGGLLFEQDSTTRIRDGQFIPFADGQAGLRFTPAHNSVSAGSFVVQASTSPDDAGLGQGSALGMISIVPAPLVVKHASLTLTASGVQTLTPLDLKVAPADGSDRPIVYTLASLPMHGTFLLDGVPLGVNDTFTSADVAQGRLSYARPVGDPSADAMLFQARDAAGASIGPVQLKVSWQPIVVVVPVQPPPTSEDGLGTTTTPSIEGSGDVVDFGNKGARERPASFGILQPSGVGVMSTTPAAHYVRPGASTPPSGARRDLWTNEPPGGTNRSSPSVASGHWTRASGRTFGRSTTRSWHPPAQDADRAAALLRNGSPFLRELDSLHRRLTSDVHLRVWAGSASFLSLGFSVAYVIWAVRAGSLVSSLLSSMPAWKFVDPLPILDHLASSANLLNDGDGDGLERLFDEARA